MKNFFFIVLISVSAIGFSQEMTNEKLGEVLERVADTIQGGDGRWQLGVKDAILFCITDENHNRMRIITPIAEADKLDEETMKNALVANFHTALDVKYAISDEIIWSVFIHPLKELTKAQVEDAIMQVYFAKKTFGFTYSSTELVFPGNTKKKEKPRDELQKTKI